MNWPSPSQEATPPFQLLQLLCLHKLHIATKAAQTPCYIDKAKQADEKSIDTWPKALQIQNDWKCRTSPELSDENLNTIYTSVCIYPKLLNPRNFSGSCANLGFTRDVGEKPGFFRKIMGLEEKPGFFPIRRKLGRCSSWNLAKPINWEKFEFEHKENRIRLDIYPSLSTN